MPDAVPTKRDPRPLFAGLLGSYLLLGWLAWGIDRQPLQAITTVGVAVLADLLFNRWLRPDHGGFPWSGLITGFGLCLLLNFGANPWLPVLPAVVGIASKTLFSIKGRHFFNPGLFGLIVGMWLSGGMLSPSPAYQWGGGAAALFVIAALGLVFSFPHLKAKPLVAWFIGLYLIQTCLRAWVLRHHLPAEAVLLGSLTSPAFFLFAFYMLTDPATTPRKPLGQFLFALAVVVIDLVLHFRQSYSTLFPALFAVQGGIYLYHFVRGFEFRTQLPRLTATAAVALLTVPILRTGDPANAATELRFEEKDMGLEAEMSGLLDDVDSRVAHIAKWILSVGDAVAVADVDNDGWQDIFLTYPMKSGEKRAALMLNRGGEGFERLAIPDLERFSDPARYGLPSSATFADVDNDGDADLFVGVGYGESRLLINQLSESGKLEFRDETELRGISGHTVCLSAAFFDPDRDGDLDLFVCNAMNPYLADYDQPTPLNPFVLPSAEFAGDRRMFHFMHASWHNATNGGLNRFYRNLGDGRFEELDPAATGLDETHWSLAVNTADFDGDGWQDLYVASDFGPDDIYRNLGGCRFERISGTLAGSLGRDTYKGMNATVADFDGDGRPDVQVSNVHAPLQAEGSLLWINRSTPGHLTMKNEAVKRGALNAHRFGWGAAAGDIDLDGWPDLVQCNGMVDDHIDRRFEEPKDYWYANANLARTGPEVHAYADRWGDLRGYSIWGSQRMRLLLNRGGDFADAATTAGLDRPGNTRGAVLVDFDRDGDLDLLVTRQFDSAIYYENRGKPSSGWLAVHLVGDGHKVARDAIGTRVSVDGRVQWVTNISGFAAQQGHELHFAAGTDPVEIEVLWPDGSHWKGSSTTRRKVTIKRETEGEVVRR
ncbi:FG-GAP-like repeat-containing protein [Haloferula sp.]|uniref:FG-GAP-like repeat-containing protein n=1 Tax=Haloferula sp. TaxID=2497595 RepID=UPI003C77AF6E